MSRYVWDCEVTGASAARSAAATKRSMCICGCRQVGVQTERTETRWLEMAAPPALLQVLNLAANKWPAGPKFSVLILQFHVLLYEYMYC